MVPGGRLAALSHPEKLVELLLRFERELRQEIAAHFRWKASASKSCLIPPLSLFPVAKRYNAAV